MKLPVYNTEHLYNRNVISVYLISSVSCQMTLYVSVAPGDFLLAFSVFLRQDITSSLWKKVPTHKNLWCVNRKMWRNMEITDVSFGLQEC